MEYPVYCEQPYFSGFFEPLNTITNLFFVLAGILLIIKLKHRNKLDYKAIYLSVLLIIIGIGSFAWHFYRTPFTLIIDSVPIGIFILSYLYFYLTITVKNIFYRIIIYIGFFIYTALLVYLLQNLCNSFFFGNGGLGYIVAISYFLLLQIYNYFYKPKIIKSSIIIVFLFFLSIISRQIDLKVCSALGFGTHFLWHILNSIVLYLFVKLLYSNNLETN